MWRAYNSTIGIQTIFQGSKVRLTKVCILPSKQEPQQRPGSFFFDKNSNTLSVVCGDGNALGIEKLKIEGRREISALDFRNGFIRQKNSNFDNYAPN